jgi:hypothetical protein
LFIEKEVGTIAAEISKKVLARLSEMDYDRRVGNSD